MTSDERQAELKVLYLAQTGRGTQLRQGPRIPGVELLAYSTARIRPIRTWKERLREFFNRPLWR